MKNRIEKIIATKKMRNEGKGYGTIAKELKISKTTVRRFIKAAVPAKDVSTYTEQASSSQPESSSASSKQPSSDDISYTQQSAFIDAYALISREQERRVAEEQRRTFEAEKHAENQRTEHERQTKKDEHQKKMQESNTRIAQGLDEIRAMLKNKRDKRIKTHELSRLERQVANLSPVKASYENENLGSVPEIVSESDKVDKFLLAKAEQDTNKIDRNELDDLISNKFKDFGKITPKMNESYDKIMEYDKEKLNLTFESQYLRDMIQGIMQGIEPFLETIFRFAIKRQLNPPKPKNYGYKRVILTPCLKAKKVDSK